MSDIKLEAIATVKKGKVVETIYLTEEESKMYSFNPFYYSGWGKASRTIFRILYRRNPAAITYKVLKPYYKKIGKKFTKKDAEVASRNLVRLAKKLYEIHLRETEKIDSELERRIR